MFRFFRRYQKTFIVIGGVILMFVFTVGDTLTQWLRSQADAEGRRSPKATAVSWDGGKLTEGELVSLMRKRQLAGMFIGFAYQEGMNRAMDAGLTDPPRVSPIAQFNRDTPLEALENDVVRRHIFAKRAEEMGVIVSDEEIRNYIFELGFGMVDGDDVLTILAALSPGGRTPSTTELFDAIRQELMAEAGLRALGSSGTALDLFAAEMPVDRWEEWKQMNDQIIVEAAAIDPSTAMLDVPNPTDKELLAYYEKYKDSAASPVRIFGMTYLPSPNPGFKIPRKVRLAYLRANFEDFVERYQEEVTDEQIAEYYEENKIRFPASRDLESFGDLDLESDPPETTEGATEGEAETEDASSEEGDSSEDTAEEATAEEPMIEEATGEEETSSDSEEETAEEETAEEETAEEETAEEETAEEETAEEETAEEETAEEETAEEETAEEETAEETNTESTEAEASEEQPAEGSDNSESDSSEETNEEVSDEEGETEESESEEGEAAASKPSPFRLVSLQEEEEEAESEAEAEDSDTADASSDTAGEDTTDLSDSGGEDQTEETAAEESDSGDSDATEEESEETATETGDTEEEATEVEPEYAPLEEVADDIRRRIAEDRYEAEIDDIMQSVIRDLRPAYSKHLKAKLDAEARGEEVPAPPKELVDLSPFAEKLKLEYEETVDLDMYQLLETPVGKSFCPDKYIGNQPAMVTQVAFEDVVELYEPVISADFGRFGAFADRYLVVKISDTESRVPPFKEVRDQVLAAWKNEKAAEKALEKAKETAKKAKDSGLSLEDFFVDNESVTVTKTPAFALQTVGDFAPTGQVTYRLSQPEGLEDVGAEFLSELFKLGEGDTTAQLNYDKSIVYVLRVADEVESPEQLKSLFLEEANYWQGRSYFRNGKLRSVRPVTRQILLEDIDLEWQRPDESEEDADSEESED